MQKIKNLDSFGYLVHYASTIRLIGYVFKEQSFYVGIPEHLER